MALIQINQFKGINEAVDPTMLGEEAVIAHNCDLRDGTLKGAKKPLKKYSTYPTNINQIIPYYNYEGQHTLLGVDFYGSLYYYNRANPEERWKKILEDSTITSINDYVNYNVDDKNIIIMVKEFYNIFMYDGRFAKELKKLGKNSSYDDTSNRAPQGKFIAIYNERLWIADDNNLYCSSVSANGGFDIEDFTTPTSPASEVNQHGAQIFMYTDDGTKIKGMKVVFGDLLVFKEKKIFKINGTSPADLQKTELFSGSGAIAGRSIVSTPHGCFFIHKDGIYLYDGSTVNKISEKINNLWKTIYLDIVKFFAAYYINDKYLLRVSHFDNKLNRYTYKIIEYDILTGNFTTNDFVDIYSFAEIDGELLLSSRDNDIYIYDKGTAANFIWQSGDITISEGGIEVEGVKLHTSGTGKLKVSVITEKKTKEKIVDIVKDGVKYISINNTGRSASIKLEQLSGDITIKKLYVECDVDED